MEIPVSIMALTPAILVFLQVAKQFIPESKTKFIPLIALVIGIIIVGIFEGFSGVNAIFGAIVGLSATGLFQLRNTIK